MPNRWPFEELFTALKPALESQLTSIGNVPVVVYDHVADNASFPFCVIGEFTAQEDQDDLLFEVTVTVRLWSVYPGGLELMRMLDQGRRALQFQHVLTNDFSLCDEGVTENVSIEDVTEDSSDRSVRVATIDHRYRIQSLR